MLASMRAPATEPAPMPAMPAVDRPVFDEDAPLWDVWEGWGAGGVARLKAAVACVDKRDQSVNASINNSLFKRGRGLKR